MRCSKGSLAFVLGLSFLAGCGGDKSELAPQKPEAAETACGDGADNDGDGHRDCDDLDCRAKASGCSLAPPLERSVATTLGEAARFLYSGPDPLQKGVDASVFAEYRVAIVRGKVVAKDGESFAGVRVSIARHLESRGQTKADLRSDFAQSRTRCSSTEGAIDLRSCRPVEAYPSPPQESE